MAIGVRYFSTTSAGTGDGTSWANRAALFSAGNWSSIITGWNFGADALEARIGPGSYTCSQTLNNALITTDPTATRQLYLVACDTSGNRWTPPDPDWTSDQPPWSEADMPVIATTTNIATIDVPHIRIYGIVFTAGAALSGFHMIAASNVVEWCIIRSAGTASPVGGTAARTFLNCCFECTGSNYNTVLNLGSNDIAFNCRAKGPAGSSGNRYIMSASSAAGTCVVFERCTAIGGQIGLAILASETNQSVRVNRCVIVGPATTGVDGRDFAGQFRVFTVSGCVIANCGGIGINARQSLIHATNNRFRDNASGNFANMGDQPTDLYNYTTDADDAADFVDAANGNYRIKSTAGFAGRNIGVSEESSSGGGPSTRWGPVRLVRP